MDLTRKRCIPCERGMPPMSGEEIKKYAADIPDWNVIDGKKIAREFKFKDFRASMAFAEKVADIAENDDHHPDIHIFYNKVRLDLTTHAVGGLSENDFIVAAKIDMIEKQKNPSS